LVIREAILQQPILRRTSIRLKSPIGSASASILALTTVLQRRHPLTTAIGGKGLLLNVKQATYAHSELYGS
jgi:hypothetical protein